jgi:tetratricopeptide (TPR) repeat protein
MLTTLLTDGIFHPDGQILDEDFEYNSFVQSRMFEKGVSCRDCHDVHGARRLKDGNELCTRCHRADTYDTPNHHFHKPVADGKPAPAAQCTSCHMPGSYFMVVHFRRDHSMRVPRPDLTASIGTPNACSAAGCHADKPLRWVNEKYDGWYGKVRKPHYGPILAAGRAGRPEAAADLIQLARDLLRPAIARATALAELGSYPGQAIVDAFERSLGDEDALVRWAAVEHFPAIDAQRLMRALGRALKDSARGVRAAAAGKLAPLAASLPESQRPAFEAALAEYVDGQTFMSDMPSGPYNLGNLRAAQGQSAEAERQLRRSLAIDDRFFPAKMNLAMLVAAQGRSEEAERLLREVDRERPGQAAVSFNLGLLLAERGRTAEAETALRAALKADPTMAQAAYNLAVLIAPRDLKEAIAFSTQAAALDPNVQRYGFSLAFFQRQAGDTAGAITTLEDILRRRPDDRDAQALLAELRAGRSR